MTTSDAGRQVLMYGEPGCPDVITTRRVLRQAGVAYDYVDIRQDEHAEARVRALNGGRAKVPTLVFPDGSTLTEPSVAQLRARLAPLGYRLDWRAWLTGYARHLLIGVIVLWGLLRLFGIL